MGSGTIRERERFCGGMPEDIRRALSGFCLHFGVRVELKRFVADRGIRVVPQRKDAGRARMTRASIATASIVGALELL